MIDNFPVLRADFEDMADLVQDLGTRGPGYGIHLILATGRWADIRMQLQAAIGTKVELRLNDPVDSTIARKAAANLRADTPGRAIVEPGLQVHICLPSLAADRAAEGTRKSLAVAAATALPPTPDEIPEDDLSVVADELAALEAARHAEPAVVHEAVSAASTAPVVASARRDRTGPVEQLVARIAAAWEGPPVPPIRMLPLLVPYSDVAAAAGPRRGVVIGVDETDLRPVELDLFGTEPHLLVFGDAETGKTSLLRMIVSDLTGKMTDNEVVFAVFDVRRTLLDVVPEDYLGAYAGTAAMAAGMAGAVAGELRGRMPPDDVTAAQLRERSWWKGPEIVVVADDYDLLSPGGAGPLAPFIEFLPQARDLGFHLILARRSGGAGRAMYEPVPQRMREVGAAGVLLSGDRQEGALFPGAYLSVQPPGRGHLVRRGRKPALVQLAYLGERPHS